MSIFLNVHEPWHYHNWEPVLRHLRPEESSILVSPWCHRGADAQLRRQAVARTRMWLRERGVDSVAPPIEEEPHVLATLGIEPRAVGRGYARQVRMLYAVISKQYTYSELNRDYDCVMVASTFGRQLLDKRGIRAEVVGYPKLDDVFNGVMTRESARARLGLSPDAKVVLYAPTFGPLCTVEEHGPALADLDPSIELLVQLHPVSYLAEPQRFAQLPGRARWLGENDAGVESLVAADVVLTDYSGVIFEACAIDRPVILLDRAGLPMTDDVERVYRDAGPRIERGADLAAAVERALSLPEEHAERREHYRTTFYEYRGQAGLRAAEALRGFEREARRARERDVDRIYTRMRALESRLATASA